MRKSTLILFFIISAGLMGCLSHDSYSTTGTIVLMELEGGFYGIVTNEGENLLPQNLDEEMKVNGLIIRFNYVEKTDVMSIHQWGTPVELTSFEIAD